MPSSSMDKVLLMRIGYVSFAIAIILIGINSYRDYQWEQEQANFKASNEQILGIALERGDISNCANYSFRNRCIVLVGQKLGDIGVCDKAFSEDYMNIACKAAVQQDISICAKNLNGTKISFCETMHDQLLQITGLTPLRRRDS